jgi:tRNA-guanine family transglycosylase
MENVQRFNPNLVTIPRSAFFIEKVHCCADCPIRRLAVKRPQSVFARLHTWHNLHFYQTLMQRMRRALVEGTWANFRREFLSREKEIEA